MSGGLRAVALGGGHGLHVTLRALRRLTDDVTAVVTVADDGGSSGRLRRELGLLPPGDLRQALVALADDDGAWSSVFQHRFGGDGALAGHAVGNLMLAGLIDVLGDPVRALEQAGKVLGIRGRVLPMSTEPLDIEADVVGLDSRQDTVRRIRGQVAVATTPGRVLRIRLHSRSAKPIACAAALDAVRDADVVLLGPGSWFTSVLPHLLLPDLVEALVGTTAGKIVIVNLIPQPGETSGFSPQRHLDVLCEHAPRMRVDAVVADTGAVPDPTELRRSADALGARVLLDDVAIAGDRERHDPDALAASLRRALRGLASASSAGGSRWE